MEIVRSFRFKLMPTKAQRNTLDQILEDQRHLYNAALQERIECYSKTKQSISLFSQTASLTQCRQALPEMAALPANLQRATLKRLDEAFKGFFARLKTKAKAGFPRFKGKNWWTSFGFVQFRGLTLKGNRVRFKSLPGSLRIHMHRDMPTGKLLSCSFKKTANQWYISIQIRYQSTELPINNQEIGLDMGLSALLTDHTGKKYENPRHTKNMAKELRRRQRALSRCKRGSLGRKAAKLRVTKWHQKIANTRETHLHQITSKLVKENDFIAIEALNIKGMAAGLFAKSVNDVAWGKLTYQLAYKAESAGRQLVKVNPRNTTRACSACGVLVNKTLADRIHECTDCGLVMCRDKNAAINILQAGRSVIRMSVNQQLVGLT